jgi:hypothetical protein
MASHDSMLTKVAPPLVNLSCMAVVQQASVQDPVAVARELAKTQKGKKAIIKLLLQPKDVNYTLNNDSLIHILRATDGISEIESVVVCAGDLSAVERTLVECALLSRKPSDTMGDGSWRMCSSDFSDQSLEGNSDAMDVIRNNLDVLMGELDIEVDDDDDDDNEDDECRCELVASALEEGAEDAMQAFFDATLDKEERSRPPTKRARFSRAIALTILVEEH